MFHHRSLCRATLLSLSSGVRLACCESLLGDSLLCVICGKV